MKKLIKQISLAEQLNRVSLAVNTENENREKRWRSEEINKMIAEVRYDSESLLQGLPYKMDKLSKAGRGGTVLDINVRMARAYESGSDSTQAEMAFKDIVSKGGLQPLLSWCHSHKLNVGVNFSAYPRHLGESYYYFIIRVGISWNSGLPYEHNGFIHKVGAFNLSPII